MSININQLSKFLVKAKINTYASSGEEGEKILEDGAKELKFGEGKLKYRDRYFGFNPFIGEEIVFQNGKSIWGMNYYGGVISEVAPPRKIYQFLQEVLKKIRKQKPFRGPDKFKKDDFEYINKTKGDIEKFEGEEAIFYKRQIVYKLNYHGGLALSK